MFHCDFLNRILFLLCLFYFNAFAKPMVSVSIPPQAFFVEKIAKDTLDINIIIPANSDEHNFEFKPQSLKNLEKSDIYFTSGLEFEKSFLDKFKQNFKHLKIIDTQKNITLLSISHKQEKNSALDMHTWLDPILVKTQAQNIAQALIQNYPENKVFYEKNLKTFLLELDALNATIIKEFKGIKNNKFIVYHPSWSYFAKRYHLEQIPVEIEGKEPKPKDLQKLIESARKNNIKVIFVQTGFPENAANTLAKECGAKIVQINHLSQDWENELLKSAKILAQSLK